MASLAEMASLASSQAPLEVSQFQPDVFTRREINCRVCMKQVTVDDIISHIMTHTDLRPYKCGYCGTRLRRKADFTRHVRNHIDYIKHAKNKDQPNTTPKKKKNAKTKKEMDKANSKFKAIKVEVKENAASVSKAVEDAGSEKGSKDLKLSAWEDDTDDESNETDINAIKVEVIENTSSVSKDADSDRGSKELISSVWEVKSEDADDDSNETDSSKAYSKSNITKIAVKENAGSVSKKAKAAFSDKGNQVLQSSAWDSEVSDDDGDDDDDDDDYSETDDSTSSEEDIEDKIKCPICNKEQEAIIFETHVRACRAKQERKGEKQEKKLTFVCTHDGCDKKFKYSRQLDEHIRIHTGEKPFSCEECHKSFRTSNLLSCHKERHASAKRYKCKVCDEIVAKSSMRFHQALHEGTAVGFKCDYCGAIFRLKTVFIRHVRVHTGERPYACDYCGKTFVDRPGKMAHEKCHTTERPFKCEKCDKTFKRSNHLTDHMSTHSDALPYHCSHCSAKFKYTKSLNKHVKIIHQGVERKVYARRNQRKSRAKGTAITISNESREVNNHADYQPPYHESKITTASPDHESEMTIATPDHESEVTIATSMISQSKSSALLKDAKQATNPVSLESIHCMIRTVKAQRQRKVSKKPRPYVCKTCGRDYTESRHLREHERLHSSETPFKCDFCPEKFRTFAKYNVHRMNHTGERPHKCKYCKWSFKSRGALIDHERKHTGERPFKCKVCDKAFLRSTHLRSHYVTHSTEQLWNCTMCRVKFKYMKTLKRHMKNKHKMDLKVMSNSEVLPIQGKRNPLPPGAGELIQ